MTDPLKSPRRTADHNADPTRRSLSAAASVLRDGVSGRVELDSFLDEELAVLLRETGLPGSDVWMPWTQQHPESLEAGAASVRRILMHRRHLVPEALAAELEERESEIADESLVADPTTAGTLLLRRSAIAVTTALRRISVDGELRELRVYLYHQSVGVTLEETVTAEGLHSFAVLPTSSAGARLARVVDPQEVASTDSEIREIAVGAPAADWGEEIAEGTRHLTQVVISTPEDPTARSASFHATDHGVHVTVTDPGDAEEEGSEALQVVEVAPDSLIEVLDEIVAVARNSAPDAI